ncbi:NRAMP family divalent metal transporter [Roseateles violae]|uniref:Divalent metal cation transporter n=1 Tax=Roseateles violae TaxID=3058042 RepID=A0ABT8DNN1_9BURK|nr:divalent metal cation transporter [Pelomonas sp. PFR6]MDN3919976.1 divalent metal cation transporter [Pelomonas sp. PFR6]
MAAANARKAGSAAAAKALAEDEGNVLQRLGPGLITGAADDDPSGIATYSQAGAQFRFGLVWTLLLTTPLMIAVQLVSARIGYVTSRGLAANMNRLCPRWVTVAVVAALVVANTINIAADVSAMAEATRLLLQGPQWLYVLAYGVLSALAQVYISYERTVRVLKYLTLVLFAYVALVLVLRVPWAQAWSESIRPWAHLQQGSLKDYAAMVVAMLGTTISPYLFFWQATQEVEDQKCRPLSEAQRHQPQRMKAHLRSMRQDTLIGMLLSNGIAFCIVLSAAVALNLNGHTNIHSSADAAAALEPVAGRMALAIFSLGIIGTGLLAIPVLAGSAAYAVSEVFGWRAGLSRRFQDARGFYSIILTATLFGTGLSLFQVDAIAALVWSAVINGVIAVPVMAILLLIGRSKSLMGRYTVPRATEWAGWVATGVMGLAAVLMFVTMA